MWQRTLIFNLCSVVLLDLVDDTTRTLEIQAASKDNMAWREIIQLHPLPALTFTTRSRTARWGFDAEERVESSATSLSSENVAPRTCRGYSTSTFRISSNSPHTSLQTHTKQARRYVVSRDRAHGDGDVFCYQSGAGVEHPATGDNDKVARGAHIHTPPVSPTRHAKISTKRASTLFTPTRPVSKDGADYQMVKGSQESNKGGGCHPAVL